MVLISVIINLSGLGPLRESITGFGLLGMTVTEVKGFGRPHGPTQSHDPSTGFMDFVPRIKVEIAVNRCDAEACVQAILACTRGQDGDGTLHLTPLTEAVRIRTGEKGPKALGQAVQPAALGAAH